MSPDVKINIFLIQWVKNTICTKDQLDQRPFLGFGHNLRPKPVGVKYHRMSKIIFFRIQGVKNTMCTKDQLDQRPFLGFGHNWRPKPVGVKRHLMSK